MTAGSLTRIADLDVYLAPSEPASRAGVLLLPAVSGLGPKLRGWADQMADNGLTALAWDPFHGADITGLSYPDLQPLLSTLLDAAALTEQRTLVNHMINELGVERVGVLGWCLGGRFALVYAAHDHRIAACASYHPSIRTERRPNQTEDAFALANQIECPVQWVHPGADQVLTPDLILGLRDALVNRTTGATDFQVYPGADHGFMERETTDANRTATKLAWPTTIAFLRAALLA